MATSGSYDVKWTRNKAITAALQRVGACPAGQEPEYQDHKVALDMLNMMLRAWQNEHIFLSSREWLTQTLTASSEVTGTDGNIYTCIRAHTSAAANTPVTGADYTSYWYQRGSTGGTWATATAYTSVGEFTLPARVVDVEKMFVRDTDGSDSPIRIISFNQYLDLDDKFREGEPYFAVVKRQSSASSVYLYPIPDDTDYVIHYLAVSYLADMDNAADDFDLPVQWTEAIVAGLTYKLGFVHGAPQQDMQLYKLEAESEKRMAQSADTEATDSDFLESAF